LLREAIADRVPKAVRAETEVAAVAAREAIRGMEGWSRRRFYATGVAKVQLGSRPDGEKWQQAIVNTSTTRKRVSEFP